MAARVSSSSGLRKILLVLSSLLLAIGFCGGPLIMRLYFIHGGSRVWLSSWLQTCGCPIILIPLIISYFSRRQSEGPGTSFIYMKLSTFVAAAFIGVLAGLVNYLFSYGVGHLPVSTATLITTTQLVFTAFFAFILVKQKFTAYTINSIFLLTLGAVVLALQGSKDRPQGESKKLYILGFVLTFAGSALSGALAPFVEFTYKKTGMGLGYTQVMETQIVISFFAAIFSVVGMLANSDFKVIPREAREFQLGESKYYGVLVSSAIVWQFYLLGIVGVIFNGSSLLSGIVVAALLPISEVLAVIFYHEKFTAEKGVSLILCLWGFASHFYGEKKHSNNTNQMQGSEIVSEISPHNSKKETDMASDVVP